MEDYDETMSRPSSRNWGRLNGARNGGEPLQLLSSLYTGPDHYRPDDALYGRTAVF